MRKLAGGIAVAVAIAGGAWLVAPFVKPYVAVDATFLALLLGLVVGAIARHPPALDAGAQRTLKFALLAGVVLLGVEVNAAFIVAAGGKGVALAAALIALTLLSFWAMARLLRVEGDTWALLGAGTGICGLSAVAATGASLESDEDDIAVAVAAIGLLSAVGLIVYPIFGKLMDLPPAVYGAWSGLSVHAVANAIATGFAFGDEAGKMATVTKLARVALLAPMLLLITFTLRRRAQAKGGRQALLPDMVWGFLAVALVVSFVPLPAPVLAAAKTAGKLALVLGMAALGYTTRLGHFRRAGPRGIAMAVAGWAILSVAALAGAWWLYR